MRKILLLWLFFLAIAPLSAQAVVVKSLYQAIVPVDSQSANSRQQAMPVALKQVLIKLSGNPNIASLPKVQSQLENANKWVQQYSYQTTASQQLMLHVLFLSKPVKQLLRGANQAVWGANRPLVLFWVAESTPAGQQLLNDDNNADAITELKTIAEQRGLPVLLPLLDLQDIGRVTFNDVSTDLTMPVLAASERYDSQAVVMATLQQQQSGTWKTKWVLLINGQRLSWNEEGRTLDNVITKGINDISEALARRYAVLGGGNELQRVQLSVNSVRGLKSYTKVVKYLKNLTPVKNVQVQLVEPNKVVFDVDFVGSERSLQNAIALENIIKPEAATVENNLSVLNYTLS